MKTQTTVKPTQEEKAAYMATHWGQRILTDGVETHKISTVFNLKHEDFYILLTSLTDITDEDAIEVAKVYRSNTRGGIGRADNKELIRAGKEISQRLNGSICVTSSDWMLVIAAIDFFRSKGYALPWRDYIVEELIDFGWLKLRQKGGSDEG